MSKSKVNKNKPFGTRKKRAKSQKLQFENLSNNEELLQSDVATSDERPKETDISSGRVLLKPAVLFQPSSNAVQEHPRTFCVEMEPVVLHIIALRDQILKLKEIIKKQKKILENGSKRNVRGLPDIPSSDKCRLCNSNSDDSTQSRSGNLPSLEMSDFAKGIGTPPLKICREISLRILKMSILTICGSAGYISAKESAVFFFTDVVHEYLQHFCSMLRQNTDRCEISKQMEYLSPLEQTLYDIGLKSAGYLTDFYEETVINQHHYVLSEYHKLTKEHKELEAEIKKNRHQNKTPRRCAEDDDRASTSPVVMTDIFEDEDVYLMDPDLNNLLQPCAPLSDTDSGSICDDLIEYRPSGTRKMKKEKG